MKLAQSSCALKMSMSEGFRRPVVPAQSICLGQFGHKVRVAVAQRTTEEPHPLPIIRKTLTGSILYNTQAS
jgi:hypothetical protein